MAFLVKMGAEEHEIKIINRNRKGKHAVLIINILWTTSYNKKDKNEGINNFITYSYKWFRLAVKGVQLNNSMVYVTRKFNVAFTRALR